MGTQQKYSLKDLIFLVGPTASGKTEVSIKLAKLLNAEIISCDSMQVYKEINIVSQKPPVSLLKKIPHHMIGIVSCAKKFNVSDYRKKALGAINSILKKNKVPLIVGGTPLYMKVLIDGIFPSPEPDLELRKKLEKESDANAPGYLYKKLEKVDLETAKLLHPNDIRRIVRALEIYYKTGTAMSVLKKTTHGLSRDFNIKIFCLGLPREELYSRINNRVEKMFRQGIIKECKILKKKKLSLTASQILGCKEVFAFLDKKISKQESKELLKKNTRHFAKRQISWFRNDPRVVWVSIKSKETAGQVAARIEKVI